MYVRLAFAVAAHLEPEILIVDEVLAVGDAEFQKKCLGKMKDVATAGRTVLFVSHHMQSVSVLCQKAIFLEKGRLTYLGPVSGGIDRYVKSFEKSAIVTVAPERRAGTGEMRLTSVVPDQETYGGGDVKTVHYRVERKKPFEGKYFISCHMQDQSGFTVLQCDSRMVGHWIEAGDVHEGSFTIRTPWLRPGSYRLDFFLCSSGVMDRFEQACHLEVIPLLPYPAAGNEEATEHGVVFADFSYAGSEPQAPKAAAVEFAGCA